MTRRPRADDKQDDDKQDKAGQAPDFTVGQSDRVVRRSGIRCVVVHPYLKHGPAADDGAGLRSPEAALEEALGLARAIELDPVLGELVALQRITPATYLGDGKVRALADYIAAEEAELVVMDCALSPIQQRNLERALKAKVIDRTGLILEIFGARAQTREGVLQVELAHLSYQQSRLVRSWTHLERQRGGFGFLGGPGESQIETDRRILRDRIAKLKKELAQVSRTRSLHRSRRQKAPYPVVALVGYTNAGKSTLFNHMTEADVAAKDMLFATLDPTVRQVRLETGQMVLLSDTVGFVSNLPTQLVAAFRATLEEVLEADLILHVRDGAHPDSEAQRADVLSVLGSLGIEPDHKGPPILEVINKADLMEPEVRAALAARVERLEDVALISALSGDGVGHLAHLIETALFAGDKIYHLRLRTEQGARLAWLYRHGKVLDRREQDGAIFLSVRLDGRAWARWQEQEDRESGV